MPAFPVQILKFQIPGSLIPDGHEGNA
jgi:hypothetical protein